MNADDTSRVVRRFASEHGLSFEEVVFDADASGTAAIDLTFKTASSIMEMTTEELRDVMESIQRLCSAFEIDGAHLLLPAPAAAASSKCSKCAKTPSLGACPPGYYG